VYRLDTGLHGIEKSFILSIKTGQVIIFLPPGEIYGIHIVNTLPLAEMAQMARSILPRMAIDEALDVTRIYSVADQLPPDVPLIRTRLFRAPHYTISHAVLGGRRNGYLGLALRA